MNERGWGGGKMEDMSEELAKWALDTIDVTETQLRESEYEQ